MMVTFVSQCEKKALNKTRRVLDSFSNRIGNRTWQTVITEEGLQAVKKLLRKTASKNTAVACHWMRSRSRSELVWIVGNRRKFNHDGVVPVNTTERDILRQNWENDWHYLPLIKSLTALAALFHDWGKASEFFQKKLVQGGKIGDPLRHEWISALFINIIVDGSSDLDWLTALSQGDLDTDQLILSVKLHCHKEKIRPLRGLSNVASIISWLILSHHRLPAMPPQKGYKEKIFATDMGKLLKKIESDWGYQNKIYEAEYQENEPRCFDFCKGLPSKSKAWIRQAKKHAGRLLENLELLERAMEDGSWRLIMQHCRLALMLGDHYYSSLEPENKNREKINELDLFANTDRKTGDLLQTLDEHLVGVTKQALRNAHMIPAFENVMSELPRAFDIKELRRKSPGDFRWQDVAVTKINQWREGQKELNSEQFGFFVVNMASTGEGKTFANAKIMRALSPDEDSLRYILALGLRTLTLQTGDEYRERIGLGSDDLAVLIGSRAVLNLHKHNQKPESDDIQLFGSESMESLLENELHFDSAIPDDFLRTVLKSKKDRQFLYAPVLSCTIDHVMGATETTRGGRWLLPVLRLMSSDLVIDEIDDFTGEDLIAIGRLIHLAGMLGRKVMISSATIPPDMAEGYFNAYQAGWSLFARMRGRSQAVGCAWVDEFKTQVSSVDGSWSDYHKQHQLFIRGRVESLRKKIVKRKAEIISCHSEEKSEENIRSFYYSVIQGVVLQKHQDHFVTSNESGKQVSFGVVRMANIKPCIELTRYLLNAEWPEDVEVRCMAYHSQQVLIMRNAQEKHLDEVLKRKTDESVFANSQIRSHLDQIKAKNVIFILQATPVEEVGRDHDFDWAVVEPSSYRSFIQLAGRVLRHRKLKTDISKPNIALMQFNLKGMLGKKTAFHRPGYESEADPLNTHDLRLLLDEQLFGERLDAEPRINRSEKLTPQSSLVDLEHYSIHKLLSSYSKSGPESMQGWLDSSWWLTAIPQQYVKFRRSHPQLIRFLYPVDEDWTFVEKDHFGDLLQARERQFGIQHDENLTALENERLWMHRDYESLLRQMNDADVEKAALIYGELGFPTYGEDENNLSYTYSSQFGLIKNN